MSGSLRDGAVDALSGPDQPWQFLACSPTPSPADPAYCGAGTSHPPEGEFRRPPARARRPASPGGRTRASCGDTLTTSWAHARAAAPAALSLATVGVMVSVLVVAVAIRWLLGLGWPSAASPKVSPGWPIGPGCAARSRSCSPPSR